MDAACASRHSAVFDPQTLLWREPGGAIAGHGSIRDRLFLFSCGSLHPVNNRLPKSILTILVKQEIFLFDKACHIRYS